MDDELDAQHPASEEEYFVSATTAEKIHAAYQEAIARKYLWHEFGDLNLILHEKDRQIPAGDIKNSFK
jgi:S-adenosylmethionine:tRNA-ribosyltransferase-isomerase (queuine synthetase)